MTTPDKTPVIVLAAVVVLLLLVFAVLFVPVPKLGRETYTVTAIVNGVTRPFSFDGAPVKKSGIVVGRVERSYPDRDTFVIVMKLYTDVRIHGDNVVAVNRAARQIDIIPGDVVDSGPWRDGVTVPGHMR